jgi:hypothetical protein
MEPLPKSRSLLVVHALQAADYTLATPDFAKPALAQTHVLTTSDFTLQPPDIRRSAASPEHRLELRYQRTGRPPAIPTDAMRRVLIAQTVDWLQAERKKTRRRLVAKDPKIQEYVRGLAKRAGVHASDHELKQQITRPALRHVRGS